MGLMEWLGERADPGNTGSLQIGVGNRNRRPGGPVLVTLVISFGLVFLAFVFWETRIGGKFSTFVAVTVVYLVLSYLVHPKPDTSNLGWFGGAVDNPFRYSDDLNRFLLFLFIALWPGRFITHSLIDVLEPLFTSRNGNRS